MALPANRQTIGFPKAKALQEQRRDPLLTQTWVPGYKQIVRECPRTLSRSWQLAQRSGSGKRQKHVDGGVRVSDLKHPLYHFARRKEYIQDPFYARIAFVRGDVEKIFLSDPARFSFVFFIKTPSFIIFKKHYTLFFYFCQ